MILALLIALQLVQANDFVAFDLCYLDTMASPWEFRPSRTNEIFYIYPNPHIVVATVGFEHQGIDCVRLCALGTCRFVVGDIASVMATLRDTGNASPEGRE